MVCEKTYPFFLVTNSVCCIKENISDIKTSRLLIYLFICSYICSFLVELHSRYLFYFISLHYLSLSSYSLSQVPSQEIPLLKM